MSAKNSALFVLLVASAGLGQVQLPDGYVSPGAAGVQLGLGGQTPLSTSGTLSLFVDPTGSDSNPCTASGASACLTIDGARAKIPIRVSDAVTVNVAAGTYSAGAYITGFDCTISNGRQPSSQTAGAPSVKFIGSYSAATLATGLQTGTVASAVQGNTGLLGAGNPSTWGTFTVTGAGWTVNDLAHRLVQFTGGSCAGTVTDSVRVESNTATVATIVGIFPVLPDATCTFSIVQPASIINNVLAKPGGIYGAGFSSTTGASFVIANDNCQGIPGGGAGGRTPPYTTSAFVEPQISIEGFSFSFATNGACVALGDGAYSAVRFSDMNCGSFVDIRGNGSSENLWAESNFFNLTVGAQEGIDLHSKTNRTGWGGFARIFGNYATGASGNGLLGVSGSGQVWVVQNHVDAAATGILVNGLGFSMSSGNHYTSVGTGISFFLQGSAFSAGGSSGNMILTDGDTFSSNTGAAVQLVGGAIQFAGTAAAGSGNATGVQCDKGGQVEFLTPTGVASTTDLTINGTNYTLAQLRAASPKTIFEAVTGCRVRED